jgi:hypothetical protein
MSSGCVPLDLSRESGAEPSARRRRCERPADPWPGGRRGLRQVGQLCHWFPRSAHCKLPATRDAVTHFERLT